MEELRVEVYAAIDAERDRQNAKWNETPGVWPISIERRLAVLAEEFGEVARAILERDLVHTEEELVQVAAVAVKWLETFVWGRRVVAELERAGAPREETDA